MALAKGLSVQFLVVIERSRFIFLLLMLSQPQLLRLGTSEGIKRTLNTYTVRMFVNSQISHKFAKHDFATINILIENPLKFISMG